MLWRLAKFLANPTAAALAAAVTIPMPPYGVSLSLSSLLPVSLLHTRSHFKTASASATPTDAATSIC